MGDDAAEPLAGKPAVEMVRRRLDHMKDLRRSVFCSAAKLGVRAMIAAAPALQRD